MCGQSHTSNSPRPVMDPMTSACDRTFPENTNYYLFYLYTHVNIFVFKITKRFTGFRGGGSHSFQLTLVTSRPR